MKPVKYSLLLVIGLLVLASCSEKQKPKGDLAEHRKETHEHMLSDKSPIPEEERKNFLGLNYYPGNPQFAVRAKFDVLFNGEVITFETNTDRRPRYQKYARMDFLIGDTACTLFAYKALDHEEEGLFVPFTDLTNGNGSYATGRYLDVSIPEGDSLTLDFNKSYNPYCAYNDRYSCPVPPQDNQLVVHLLAGEKKYH
ncbi:DUF1684 domain-containing protein [bacterium SCSIO 12741]|nr:DUF1684 domain-containing protein [bacterium SCSIO 12741]